MASIHKEIVIEVPPEHVWAAVRDVDRCTSASRRAFLSTPN